MNIAIELRSTPQRIGSLLPIPVLAHQVCDWLQFDGHHSLVSVMNSEEDEALVSAYCVTLYPEG